MSSPSLRWARSVGLLSTLVVPLTLPASDVEIAELRRQIAALDAKLQALESRADATAAAPPAPPPPAVPTTTATADGRGVAVVSPDKKFQFRVRGNIQADARFFINDGGILNNDGFLLRRVRPSFEGTIAEKYTFRIMPDFAPDTPTLLDTWVAYQPTPEYGFLVGRSKSPLSLERLASQTALLFVERAYPASLLPNRDVGFYGRGKLLDGRLDWQAGVQKGARDGASASSSSISDDDPEVVLRLFAHPFAKDKESPLQGLGVGFAIARDRSEGVAPSNYRTLAQQTFFSWGGGTTIDGELLRWSPQGYWYHGSFGLLAEYAVSTQEIRRGANFARLTNRAWQVAVSWVATGEKASYRGVTPASNFDPAAGHWGAFEFAARLSGLSVDEDAFPLFADPNTSAREVLTSTLGLNWYPNRNLKLVVNYETSGFTGGLHGTVTRQREHAVISRVQFSF